MSVSEKTPLTNYTGPHYAFQSNVLRQRKKRILQFQYCISAILLLIVITISVVTISYMQNQDLEINEDAIDSGTNALKARDILEEDIPILKMSSPSYKHQKAVATSEKANSIARAGYAGQHASIRMSALHKRTYNEKNPMTETCDEQISHSIAKAKWSLFFTCTNNLQEHHCPENGLTKYRSIDGSCNNLKHPLKWGVAYTPFRRSLPASYANGINKPRLASDGNQLPSAVKISTLIHRPMYHDDENFTVMLAIWGQFLDHDITATALSHGKNGAAIACCTNASIHPECFSVIEDGNCMEFVRSAPAPSCCLGPRNQINQASSYIDASVVYGSNGDLTSKLRSYKSGKLVMFTTPSGRELLPPSVDPNDGCNREKMNKQGKYCFLSGDLRSNENLHLTSMHLLWARQHNFVAAKLQSLNPQWTDEQLFQETRRILAAQMQHITYNEFLPIILGNTIMKKYNLTVKNNFMYTYNESIDATITNEFAAAAFRFAHTLIPGLMKVLSNDTSSPEYVQMHKMLFNPYILYDVGGLDSVLRGAIHTHIEAADPYFSNELKTMLFENDPAEENDNTTKKQYKHHGLDLVALNIQRGRDHGLKSFSSWRKYCGLKQPSTFHDLIGEIDNDSLTRISKLYTNINDVDIYTGLLSEIPLQGSLLGPTASCLITEQFVRLKFGDRYWYENGHRPQTFTMKQLTEIKRTSLAGIICDNSDDVHKVPQWVMQHESKSNLNMLCKSIERPDLSQWQDISLPVH